MSTEYEYELTEYEYEPTEYEYEPTEYEQVCLSNQMQGTPTGPPSSAIYESIKSDFMKMVHPIIAEAPRPKSLAVKIARRRNFLVLFSHEFLLSPFFYLSRLAWVEKTCKSRDKILIRKDCGTDANFKSPGIHPNKCTQAAERS